MALTTSPVEFVRAERLCSGTALFVFTRPDGHDFTAGQFFQLTIPTAQGEQTHSFSYAAAPADDEISVLTRLTGSVYKDALLAMRPGDTASVAGPFGNLVLAPSIASASFLVGGVGVSPARSIVRDVVQTGREVELLLFDGNQDETCIPFSDEFSGYERDRASVRFVHVLAAPSEGWTGERGFITAELVRRHCDPLDGRHWFVCGPPAMIDAMRRVVDELAIPEERRHFESFAGYR